MKKSPKVPAPSLHPTKYGGPLIAWAVIALVVAFVGVQAASNPNLLSIKQTPLANTVWSFFSTSQGTYTSTTSGNGYTYVSVTSTSATSTPRPVTPSATASPKPSVTPAASPTPLATPPATLKPTATPMVTPKPTIAPTVLPAVDPWAGWNNWNPTPMPTPTWNDWNWDAWFSDSANPTPTPAVLPIATAQPTVAPTALPTAQPTATAVPPVISTPKPSATPVPTAIATPKPTLMPTPVPTLVPTPVPTIVPTPSPSVAPMSPYQTGPVSRTYAYTVNGNSASIPFTTYAGLDQYLAALPRAISYNPLTQPVPTTADFVMRDLNEPNQAPYIQQLADQIKAKTTNADDQARIAISLVQRIPYDSVGASTGTITGKYPYETLYTDTGVCQEKSELLADVLKDLGFGTAIFRFDTQNHETVGIQCPSQYSYLGSGYCFIETTQPSIPTYSNGNYGSVGTLNTVPTIIVTSTGASMNGISQEYADAQEYDHLVKIGPVLSQADYNTWQALLAKYGLNAG